MSDSSFYRQLDRQLSGLLQQDLYKDERVLTTRQGDRITLVDGKQLINLCANNYLGLAGHPKLVEVGQQALATHGYGLASVRFICGTQDLHQQLEKKLAEFLQMEEAILYTSCFDANSGLFETLLTTSDAIISDRLNHASIIDGIRLCKAKRLRYRGMAELEQHLQDTQNCRFRLIATDGVFSMDGTIAELPAICKLADHYQALVMVDDSHAVGVLGEQGRGTVEHFSLQGQVDILTGTLGKALGGASGGYVAGKKQLIALLRQKSRPYLFSNSLPPVVVATSLAALDMVSEPTQRRELQRKSKFFRDQLQEHKFKISGDDHPIIAVIVGSASNAQLMARGLYQLGVYVVGFFYPVVPMDQARIRIQISSAHRDEDLETALSAFVQVGKELSII